MAFLSIIRRWHKREHVPIREISRRLGVSRNTIRKYLRSEQIEPKFQIPDRPSKVDPYAEKLSAWLRREENRPRKQRRTIKQLYGDLASLGYDGSYNRVAWSISSSENRLPRTSAAVWHRHRMASSSRLPGLVVPPPI
jgi:transposase